MKGVFDAALSKPDTGLSIFYSILHVAVIEFADLCPIGKAISSILVCLSWYIGWQCGDTGGAYSVQVLVKTSQLSLSKKCKLDIMVVQIVG
jgi:hypothetical protein